MIYLSEKDIVKLNVIQIKRYSPSETMGVIDQNALSMAINQPKQHIFGKNLYPDELKEATRDILKNRSKLVTQLNLEI